MTRVLLPNRESPGYWKCLSELGRHIEYTKSIWLFFILDDIIMKIYWMGQRPVQEELKLSWHYGISSKIIEELYKKYLETKEKDWDIKF